MVIMSNLTSFLVFRWSLLGRLGLRRCRSCRLSWSRNTMKSCRWSKKNTERRSKNYRSVHSANNLGGKWELTEFHMKLLEFCKKEKKNSINVRGFLKLLYILMNQREPFLSSALMSILNDICTDTGPAWWLHHETRRGREKNQSCRGQDCWKGPEDHRPGASAGLHGEGKAYL